MKGNDDTFELESVELGEEGRIDVLVETYWSKEKENGKLLETTDWHIEREISKCKQMSHYKVKVYHMNDDEFRVKIYPQSYIDAARYLWFNRNFLRIL